MLIVEKIEGSIVTIEDGDSHFNADKSLFDGEVKESDVILRLDNGRFKRDTDGTKKRRQDIIRLQQSLWE